MGIASIGKMKDCKAAYEAVIQVLDNELAVVNRKIAWNKRQFKTLADEQSKMKRERGIICDTIRTVKGRSNG